MDDTGDRSFTDAKGRTWHPRLDCRVVSVFERKTGRGILQDVYEAMPKLGEDADSPEAQAGLAAVGGKLVGNVGNLMLLLYEGCRPDSEELPKDDQGQPVSFDDFCGAIKKKQVGAAFACALTLLLEFFPTAEDLGMEEGEQGGPFPEEKAEPGPGETSTS